MHQEGGLNVWESAVTVPASPAAGEPSLAVSRDGTSVALAYRGTGQHRPLPYAGAGNVGSGAAGGGRRPAGHDAPAGVAWPGVHGTARDGHRGWPGAGRWRVCGFNGRHPILHDSRASPSTAGCVSEFPTSRCAQRIGRPSMAWTGNRDDKCPDARCDGNGDNRRAGIIRDAPINIRSVLHRLHQRQPAGEASQIPILCACRCRTWTTRVTAHRPQLILRQRLVVRLRHRSVAARRGRLARGRDLLDPQRGGAPRIRLPGVVPAPRRWHLRPAVQQQERLASHRLGLCAVLAGAQNASMHVNCPPKPW